jgi:ribosomal protein S18 acetylase RimI-like enzyme
MTIKLADLNDFENVIRFYYDLIESMQNAEFRPGWEKDIYPTRQFIHDSIAKNELFIAIIDENIVGSMVMNHDCADGYSKIKWKISVEKNEIKVIHALGISSYHQGKGIAKKMVEYAIKNCINNGIKAMRLDVLASNKPAQNLYSTMGFIYMDTIKLFYEDTGLTDFFLYELIL